MQNLEVPMAKTVSRSFATMDSSGNQIYLLMKMQCVMKDTWRIRNFPFDRQKLRLSIENSQFDSESLVFVRDTLGKNYDRGLPLATGILTAVLLPLALRNTKQLLEIPHMKYPTANTVLTGPLSISAGMLMDCSGKCFWACTLLSSSRMFPFIFIPMAWIHASD